MATAAIRTPVGVLRVREGAGAIDAVDWSGRRPPHRPETAVLRAAVAWLEDYFAGRWRPVDFALRPEGTPFQRQVWSEIARLPAGATATYGEIAARLGTSARAVGGACAANPLPVLIPCHRVVAAGGGPGGYSGGAGAARGIATKRALLAHEAAAPRRRGDARVSPAARPW